MKKESRENKFNLWSYFFRHKYLVLFFVFLTLANVGFDFAVTISFAKFLAVVTEMNFNGALMVLIVVFVLYLVLLVINHLMVIVYNRMSNIVINEMRVDVAYQSLKISDKAYTEHGTGSFTQRISADPSKIFNKLNSIVSNIGRILGCIATFVYIMFNDYRIGLIALLSVFIYSAISMVQKKVFTKNLKELNKRVDDSSGILNELIRSEKDVKSLNLEDQLKGSVKEKLQSVTKQDIKTITKDRRFVSIKNFFARSLEFAMLAFGLYLYNHALITLAVFMFVYSNRNEARVFGLYFSETINSIAEIKVAKKRIDELFEDDEYELEHFGTKRLKNVKGNIEFKNVYFAYDLYKEKTNEQIKQEEKENKKKKIKAKVKSRVFIGKKNVIENMNFKIEPNTTVAFVGKSGSGKSTILQLISKMYECDKGKVLIDGVDIKTLDKETIRSSIALVNQFPYIFDMTIKENLLLAKKDATDEEIDKAIKDSALYEFVKTLPDGLETKVGESGIKLSGGQKQRLAIARALLRKTPIIIFDESTSSLDNIAQNQVRQSIENIKGQSTIIIVAHRLSTIKNVDKIFFLDGGEIKDEGTFNELFKNNKDFKTIFLAENLE